MGLLDLNAIPRNRYLRNVSTLNGLSLIYSILFFCYKSNIKNPEKAICYKKFLKHLNLEQLIHPIKSRSIKTFVKNNSSLNIKVNIFLGNRYRNKQKSKFSVVPYLLNIGDGKRECNILMILQKNKSFFIPITNIINFLAKRYHSLRSVCTKIRYICKKCFQGFTTFFGLETHNSLCKTNLLQREIYFPKHETLSFSNYQNTVLNPITLYADFESGLRRNNAQSSCCCKKFPCECNYSYSDVIQQHSSIGFGLAAVDCFNKIIIESSYIGKNASSEFLEVLIKIAPKLVNLTNQFPNPPKLTANQDALFKNAKNCVYCMSKFAPNHLQNMTCDTKMKKVVDHCHYSNKILGIACSFCNIARQYQRKFKVYFHNFCHYDSKLMLEAFSKMKNTGNISLKILPKNSENYRLIEICLHLAPNQKIKYCLVDSMEHLNASLSTLVDVLNKTNHPYPLLRQSDIVKNKKQIFCKKRFDVLKAGKGIIAYDIITDISTLNKYTFFPPKSDFSSILNNKKKISDEDYKFAHNYYQTFQCKNYGENIGIYVQQDVILLAEVMQSFRFFIYKIFQLDPLTYFSLPSFSFDLMLKQTQIKLQHITEPDMYNFLQSSIRGGMAFVNTKYSEGCKNKHEKFASFLVDWDVNSLYGLAQTKFLPVSGFKWSSENEIKALTSQNFKKLREIDENDSVAYFVQVDLEYPPNLHDSHNDFILAPYRKIITIPDLSAKTRSIFTKTNRPMNNTTRLITDFLPRKKYIVHSAILKFYLQEGMIITKIWRCVQFTQKDFLHAHIDKLTSLRAAAKTAFYKKVLKLIVNSLYGKFNQDPRKYMSIRLVTTSKHFMKLASKPQFHSATALSEDVVAIRMIPTTINFEQFPWIGSAILEYAKLTMYHDFYKIFVEYYGRKNIELLMSDTDSFLLKVFSKQSLHTDLKNMKKFFDFSNYPEDDELFDKSRQNELGLYKNVTAGKGMIKEFVGLQAKSYCYNSEFDIKKVAKGCPRKNHSDLRFDMYLDVLLSDSITRQNFASIRTKKLQLNTVNIRKIMLSNADVKKYQLDCGIHSLGFGHWRINKTGGDCKHCQ